MEKISVIIPVYNQWELTKNCLCSLQAQTPKSFAEVIVVDNGSSDATLSSCPELGQSLFGDEFRFFRFEENRNFAPACNFGAEQAKSNFLFFLNNDTILQPNWLSPLLIAFEKNPKLGAVGPLLTYEDGRVQHLGVGFSPSRSVLHLYHQFPKTHRLVSKKRNLQAITAAAMLIPKKVFEQAGRFFEEYKNGFEDLDLCALIRRLGLQLSCETKSEIVHLTSKSEGRFAADRENAALFTARCGNDFFPDEHIFAREDGFSLYFNAAFQPQYIYKSSFEGNELGKILSQVQNEPFWEQGYELLAEHFRQQKMWREVLDILLFQIEFFYSEELLVEILKMATKLGRKDLLASFSKYLTDFEELTRFAFQKYTRTLEYARQTEDAILLSACEDWAENR